MGKPLSESQRDNQDRNVCAASAAALEGAGEDHDGQQWGWDDRKARLGLWVWENQVRLLVAGSREGELSKKGKKAKLQGLWELFRPQKSWKGEELKAAADLEHARAVWRKDVVHSRGQATWGTEVLGESMCCQMIRKTHVQQGLTDVKELFFHLSHFFSLFLWENLAKA